MTVPEVIAILSSMPFEAKVRIWTYPDGPGVDLRKISMENGIVVLRSDRRALGAKEPVCCDSPSEPV